MSQGDNHRYFDGLFEGNAEEPLATGIGYVDSAFEVESAVRHFGAQQRPYPFNSLLASDGEARKLKAFAILGIPVGVVNMEVK